MKRLCVLALLPLIASCSSVPNWSMPSFSVPQMEFPDIDVARLWSSSDSKKLVRAAPYSLTTQETQAMQAAVRAAFPTDWSVTFVGARAGRLPGGKIAVCGVATAGTNKAVGYPFRVMGEGGAAAAGPQFQLRQLGRSRDERLSIYIDCNALGLV
ncbi:hypothetical protein [Jiella sp. M17.18]|uniref:hypothetical protein n=1 Tax=Jiella sp. M17.18 TaxID=3234247 RepID=UPI0034DFBB44